MPLEINKSSTVRLSPIQEMRLAKSSTELYVGQILKAVVVQALTPNQVLIHINGQNLNAKTSHQFETGELLDVKVMETEDELVLQIQNKTQDTALLRTALLESLPKQASANTLLTQLNELLNSSNIPMQLRQQITNLLFSITPLSQIQLQLAQAINQSGLFFESSLLDWQRNKSSQKINNDFKGLCLKLLNSLPEANQQIPMISVSSNQDPIPIHSSMPQPLVKDPLISLLEESFEHISHILKQELTQVLARITASQVTHLSADPNDAYRIMLDLPVRTPDGFDVIPLIIEQHKAQPMQAAHWSIAFALNLNVLGPIQGVASLETQYLDLKINVGTDKGMDILSNYQPELERLLNTMGLNLRTLSLQVGLNEQPNIAPSLHLLDIRV